VAGERERAGRTGALQETQRMKSTRKLVVAALLALLTLPVIQPAVADDRRDSCTAQDRDRDDCAREKPRFQTRFFSE
jgi:hypothetical protein